MKNYYTQSDCDQLRKLLVEYVSHAAENGNENYMLLSGGIDSMTVLYALMEANIKFKVINFRFKGYDSPDRKSVMKLQERIGFDCEYLDFDTDFDLVKDDIAEAVRICKETFGKVRAVKTETIYAMMQVGKHIPQGSNVFTGYRGDDLLCYMRNDQIRISKFGEEDPEILRRRRGDPSEDEFRQALKGFHYNAPFCDKEVVDFVMQFTTKACHHKIPKSIFVCAFGDYHKKYNSVRKPIGLHKGSNEANMFEDMAKSLGYKDALSLFKVVQK